MTLFEIHDSAQMIYDRVDRIVGYLFYFERSKRFYAELCDDLDEWDAPPMFMGHIKRGVFSIDAEWTMKWVRQRIVPAERQNIGSILRDNGLSEYDEYKLLLLSTGRCAQDELYITRITPEMIPTGIAKRLKRKVKDVIPLSGNRILAFFRDDTGRNLDLENLLDGQDRFARILREQDIFDRIKVQPGGNGIEWGDNYGVPAEVLYTSGEKSDIVYSDILRFAQKRLTDTTGACEMLDCSRQNIDRLVSAGRLDTVMHTQKTRVFARAEIEAEN